MSDPQPPAFPRVSDTDGATPAGEGDKPTLFSRAGAPAEGTVVTEGAPEVTPTAAPSPMTMNSRWRWAVVGVATVLVVGLLAAVFVLAGPRAGTPSTVARYAPANTASYLELRQDLPGDQHNLLASFMSHFPGFADQAAFDQKLDESIDSLLTEMHTGFSWANDIKPWFGGEIGLFSTTVQPAPGTPPSMTVALTVKDRSALDQLLTRVAAMPFATNQEYQGATIWSIAFVRGGQKVSIVATDEALLIGTRIEDVEAALDVRADRVAGLADDQFFLQQLAALHADRLGTIYLDSRGLADTLRTQLQNSFPGNSLFNWAVDAASVRVLGEIRAEGDHLAMTTRAERPAGANLPPLPANRTTNLAELAPKDALAYVEVRDVGKTVGFAIEQLLTPQPSGASQMPVDLSGLQQMLGAPPQDYFDFVVDASVSVTATNGKLDAGLVATVDDDAVASSRVDKLLTLLHTLSQFGGGVTIDEQQHGAAKVTTITITGAPGEPSGISFAVSETNGHLYMGTGDFVVNALDRTHDQSLAARPEYAAALAAGGTANAGVAFVDVAAARAALENMLPAQARDLYNLNQQPFLAPLSHLAMVSTTDNGLMVNHVFLYVK